MTDDRGDFIFLLCSERSGSNFVTKVLDAHPEVCGPSPSHVIRTFAPNLWRYGDLDTGGWRLLCEDISDYLHAGLGVWRTGWTPQDLADAVERPRLGDLIAAIYRREAAAHDKRLIMVKENQCAELLAFLVTWFPAAKYLFVVRDPRDMALSVKRSPATHGGVAQAAALWQRDQRANLTARAILDATGRIHTTRYEDILADPDDRLADVCRFLGLEFSERMLHFNEQELTRANADRVDAWRNLSQPIMRSNSGNYRDGLSELETRYVEAVCAVEMPYFGYTPDYDGSEPLESLTTGLDEYERAEEPPRSGALSAEEIAVRELRRAVIERILSRSDG